LYKLFVKQEITAEFFQSTFSDIFEKYGQNLSRKGYN